MVMEGGTVVAKFGGSSIKYEFNEALSLTSRLWDNHHVIAVVSALKGVTGLLIRLAETGDSLERLISVHKEFAIRNGVPFEVFSPLFKELKESLSLKESFPSFYSFRDHILSFGELLAAAAFSAALRKNGIPTELLEPWNVMITDGNFGNARVSIEETMKRIPPVRESLKGGNVIVVPGFIGGFNGFRTTLGRGGSDYTASVLGNVLRSKAILLMSDVEGIYTADPRRVVSAKLIPFVSYDEAYVAATLGMKVIHPYAADEARGVPIMMGRTRNWNIGTIISERGVGFPIITHRIYGKEAEIGVVGVYEIPGFKGEKGEERGIPWVKIVVERRKLGNMLNRLHYLLFRQLFYVPQLLNIISPDVFRTSKNAGFDIPEDSGSSDDSKLWAKV